MGQLQQKQYRELLYENGVDSKVCVKSTQSVKFLAIDKITGNKSPSEKIFLHEQQWNFSVDKRTRNKQTNKKYIIDANLGKVTHWSVLLYLYTAVFDLV